MGGLSGPMRSRSAKASRSLPPCWDVEKPASARDEKKKKKKVMGLDRTRQRRDRSVKTESSSHRTSKLPAKPQPKHSEWLGRLGAARGS